MIKLNCDLGESYGAWKMGTDEQIMPYIDMANIACGFHASDPFIMDKTVKLAVQNNVTIGAHPGYPDLLGFGRRDMSFNADEIRQLVLYQVGALQAICEANGTKIGYVKPHGALYNTMMKSQSQLTAIMEAVASLKDPVPLMILANADAEENKQLAEKHSVSLLFEAFADRRYADDGNLTSRALEGSVLENENDIQDQIKSLITDKQAISISGNTLSVHADTLCVHGDNVQALESVKSIRKFIDANFTKS
ncbi:5-oxoprolinase subunit PxpA [Cocleimonas sp. KMM 6892]|uniref:5-oxoprolinase subunit PxpA n=1 Tax=unclassified Cocleimonas TaxID=2639732 RepID=UPI002DB60061|nr:MULTISPECIES: 5-oxoprolinase subunit PxpA [unclassified Cocleimonas]MEB8434409.1 5-oxoprolinase subunit PxpA [Cocleimonas sp. KMM 6892]MEC4717302.1 5-oxoprolinase subunit PxpA [Cocleimonas sp. KMM 6895]MEC4746681.1 5-oxoprolinase subunit PxpA [Cocleimonas sp. KMM 6896]